MGVGRDPCPSEPVKESPDRAGRTRHEPRKARRPKIPRWYLREEQRSAATWIGRAGDGRGFLLGLSALLLSLAAPAGPARAGFQPVPIRRPAFGNTTALTAALGSGGTGDDLLLAQWGFGAATRYYPWRDLVAPRAAPYALPVGDAADPVLGAIRLAVGYTLLGFTGDAVGTEEDGRFFLRAVAVR